MCLNGRMRLAPKLFLAPNQTQKRPQSSVTGCIPGTASAGSVHGYPGKCVARVTRPLRDMARAAAPAGDPSVAAPSQAWVNGLCRQGASAGPLHGLAFALKDMYSVEGHTNGCGNPTWLTTHAPATTTAPSVQALLDAGATLTGMVHMDELAYSLNGENVHYGTPVNKAAPERVPGGSSSGSAVCLLPPSFRYALT